MQHFNVTEHPTADWTSQQIVEAFADRDALRYLIRDRDGVYGNEARLRIASLGIGRVTKPRNPWQNPYVKRLIGSIRRDCLNHFVILNARHLKRILAWYFAYYHGSRTHLGLDKQCPIPRQVASIGRIIEIPQLGGCITVMNALLHNAHVCGRIFGDAQAVIGFAWGVFMATRPEAVVAFLKNNQTVFYCDDCMPKQWGIPGSR